MSKASSDADRPGHDRPQNATAQDASSFAPPPQYFRPPRLGIIHLLAWTAVTAVMLKFSVVLNDRIGITESSTVRRVVGETTGIVRAALLGASVVGAAVVIHGRSRGEKGRLQPGHWYVLIEAVTGLFCVTVMALLLATLPTGNGPRISPGRCLVSVRFVMSLADMGVYFVVARRLWRDGQWGWTTFAIGFVAMVGETPSLAFLVPWNSLAADSSLIPHLMVPMMCVAAWQEDSRRRVKRDWVHWLGVGIIVISSALHLASWAVFRLMLAA